MVNPFEEKTIEYYDDYLYLYEWALARLNVSDSVRNRLNAIIQISYIKELFMQIPQIHDGVKYLPNLATKTAALMDELFDPAPGIHGESISSYDRFSDFLSAVEIALLKKPLPEINRAGRLIGYGALGRVAKRLLPLLDETPLKPTELWDISGDGETVMTPDFDALQPGDTVIILPITDDIISHVENEVLARGASVIGNKILRRLLATYLYPQFEHARIR